MFILQDLLTYAQNVIIEQNNTVCVNACLFGFYGPDNTVKVMSSRSVKLLTLFPGQA